MSGTPMFCQSPGKHETGEVKVENSFAQVLLLIGASESLLSFLGVVESNQNSNQRAINAS